MRVGGVLPLLLAGGCSEAARSGRGTALGGGAAPHQATKINKKRLLGRAVTVTICEWQNTA